MRSKGDKYRRTVCYTAAAVANEAAAAQMSQCYDKLAPLITDELTREVFQVTYCRITQRYTDGDFVEQFTRLFYNTLREYVKQSRIYDTMINALPHQVTQEEDQDT